MKAMAGSAKGFAHPFLQNAPMTCQCPSSRAWQNTFICRKILTLQSLWSVPGPESRHSARTCRSERQPGQREKTGSSSDRSTRDAILRTEPNSRGLGKRAFLQGTIADGHDM